MISVAMLMTSIQQCHFSIPHRSHLSHRMDVLVIVLSKTIYIILFYLPNNPVKEH